jgi:hypothetical protein
MNQTAKQCLFKQMIFEIVVGQKKPNPLRGGDGKPRISRRPPGCLKKETRLFYLTNQIINKQ